MEPVTLKDFKKGFTLLEMLVVVAIIGVLAAVLIVGQSSFNKATLLTDTAYTVALSIREAQTLGVSSKEIGGISNAGYGVHFGSGSATTYQQFADIYPPVGQTSYTLAYCPHSKGDVNTPADRPGNCKYDSNQGELVNNYTFGQNFKISNIYYIDSNGNINSFLPTVASKSINIVYERPNTQALINYASGGTVLPEVEAIIQLTSPQGGTRCIDATQYGEIKVDQTCADTQP
jgi:prepilin-type N-terminal cleavage/methylation domain-containing protein